MANFKDGLYIARKAKGWSQERLAQEIGMTTKSVSDWERGVKKPSMTTADMVAKKLGCTNHYFTKTKQ